MKTMLILITLLATLSAASAQDNSCENGDVIHVEVDGADVTVFHDAALYNCCHDPFDYALDWQNDRLVITETEVNPQCYCICCFDLENTVENVPAGTWTLRFRWFDYEAMGWLEVDTVFTVGEVGQSGPAIFSAANDSGCLDGTTGVADQPDVPANWGLIKAYYR